MESIKQHFDQKARVYNKERSHAWLGFIVRQEKNVVMKLLNPKKGENILDAGCGAGEYATLIKENGAHVYGVDVAPNMIAELRKKKIAGSVDNIESMNLRKKFDKILSAGTLEFCEYPEKAVKNLIAHLKENGQLVILLPRRSIMGMFYWLYHRKHAIKIKLFRLRRLEEIVKETKSIVREVRRADSSFCFYAIRVQRD